jgi:hypothetical protein
MKCKGAAKLNMDGRMQFGKDFAGSIKHPFT